MVNASWKIFLAIFEGCRIVVLGEGEGVGVGEGEGEGER